MFKERERNWITNSHYRVLFSNWKELVLYTPYNAWRTFKPFNWNIRKIDLHDQYEIQILYMRVDGPINIYEIVVKVKATEEEVIKEWLSGQPWINL